MSLFESMPEPAKELLTEQKKITVRPYKRTARQPGIRDEMLQGLPREIEEYIINLEDTCTEYGGELKVIGRDFVYHMLILFILFYRGLAPYKIPYTTRRTFSSRPSDLYLV